MRLVIFHKGKKLKKDKAFGVLKLLKRHHAHVLGRMRPSNCSGKCTHEKGKYVGHGVCLLYRIIEPEYGCGKCKSVEIIRQLNFIFENCVPFKGRDLVASFK